jgi:hypothetical protein
MNTIATIEPGAASQTHVQTHAGDVSATRHADSDHPCRPRDLKNPRQADRGEKSMISPLAPFPHTHVPLKHLDLAGKLRRPIFRMWCVADA